jgi:glycerol-3-phosphate acyltransferase PlsX
MSQSAQTVENPGFPIECAPSAVFMEDGQSSMKKSKTPLIGVDLLGGDHCHPDHLIETLKGLLCDDGSSYRILLFITKEILKKCKIEHEDLIEHDRVICCIAEEVIDMDEEPLLAIRRKKRASICIAMQMLKQKKLSALISTGNTGALIASATMHIPLLEGISRAALLTLLPTKRSPIAVLDVGANIHCNPKQLVQFAKLGIAYQKSVGIEEPTIGLLNIGTEEIKGKAELRETYQLLQILNENSSTNHPIFIGNVEGKEVFSGDINVLVTDGFTGNVFLKTSEGISSFILEMLQENQHLLPFSKSLLKRLKGELCEAQYPGAILCGIDGLVMKCHGDATPQALKMGVKETASLLEHGFVEKMKKQLLKE